MPPIYFPLRWESTGDQWWYASPIDCAAANGHCDLVRELVRLDTNLLIKLTSLRRIHRLETVWDDDPRYNNGVAKCRARVARFLLRDCETMGGKNSLIQAGYGGWLLYTAASAGDADFVKGLLERDPLLVFGEGEYGITDILYAAARSKGCEVFRLLLDFSISLKSFPVKGEEVEGQLGEMCCEFRWEMMNRAVHAAARGGNSEVLKQLLWDCSDVLAYRDLQGSTILHSASGRGQLEVVNYLIATYDIIGTTDSRGNTALHVAAYRGHLSIVEALATASSSLAPLTNHEGETFLHLAVAGFRAPGFRRVNQQEELMKQLLCGKIIDVQDIINIRNNDGRTALHIAIIENVKSIVVELLMSVPSIDLNIRDTSGVTPLDLMRKRDKTTSSEILIGQLVSLGGISNHQDHMERNALAAQMKIHGTGSSPGTSFKIPDAEIFLYAGNDNVSEVSCDPATSTEISACFNEPSPFDLGSEIYLSDSEKSSSINSAARRLKVLLRWPKMKGKRNGHIKSGENDSLRFCGIETNGDDSPIPLRRIFSTTSNNKRALLLRREFASASTEEKFTRSRRHGAIREFCKPALFAHSSSSPFSTASPTLVGKQQGMHIRYCNDESFCSNGSSNRRRSEIMYRQSSFRNRLMNQYFCFGTEGLAVENSVSCERPNHS
ncbi:hypothetical protein Nepgr_003360 [Nepenthes gracilis]|uniref:Uncharacterized protein n=1 Tax=Nepenthes gracilis TaxID=150966 RepID=A0AAD3RZC5_NEPGR|nr:hypothetical protein Nepgr_003360 [Nepenthes gracilis]